MEKDEWKDWCSTVWGHSIKRNRAVRLQRNTGTGIRSNTGRVLAVTDEHLVIKMWGEPFRIRYQRIRSIEAL